MSDMPPEIRKLLDQIVEEDNNKPLPEMSYEEMMRTIRDEGLNPVYGTFLINAESPMCAFGNYGDVRLNRNRDGSYVVIVTGDRGPLSVQYFDKAEQAYYRAVMELRAVQSISGQ